MHPKPLSQNSADMSPDWAWAEYEPDEKRPWNLPRVGHLFRRATFGADWKQIENALADGPRRSVDLLVRPEADVAAFHQLLDADEDAVAGPGEIGSLPAWWLRRMILTPHPLQEKMTLFWHSHFGISNKRVNDARAMVHHIRAARQHALGSYQELLSTMSRDPAVLVGVGADENRKAMPNDHFARQLMDRLSLGPGHYAEQDVQEAARAFTGWFVFSNGRVRFVSREHDPGPKKVLGQKGQWTGDDVVRIVLGKPMAARMLVAKLYRCLISESDDPNEAILAPLASMLAENYDVGRVVETMLRSNLFFSEVAYRQRIKSPLEYAIGIVKSTGSLVPTTPLVHALSELGQRIYFPPTTSGWPGGRHWINAAAVVARENLAHDLLAPKGPYDGRLDPENLAKQYGHTERRSAAEFLVKLFLQDDLPESTRQSLVESAAGRESTGKSADWLRTFAHRLVTLPEYHLC